MKKLLLIGAFLSSCKASDLAPPVSDSPAVSTECEVLDADFITSGDQVIECEAVSPTIFSRAFKFKSDASACGAVYDLDDQLVSSNCESRWERESCSVINYHGPSDSSTTVISDIVKTENGFRANMTLVTPEETFEPTAFNCQKFD